MNIKSAWIIFKMGNNCSATVTVVRGHSRPEQIIPLQTANGNTNSISVGKEEEEEDEDDEDEDEDEDEEEEEICAGCICAGCKCCKCFKKMFVCLIPLLC